ncbi:MAG: hypothetical protein NVS9B4_00960 [Candidatus Acidiferrum sp.]
MYITLGPTLRRFRVLAAATITSSGPTMVTGSIGLSPGTSITGEPGCINGQVHIADPVALEAQKELTAAYDVAALLTPTLTCIDDIGEQSLHPGIYASGSSMLLTGELALDAHCDSDAQFIFQIASALTIGNGAKITLLQGAKPDNVFWNVGSSATIGTDCAFVGNLMAFSSISVGTNATVHGRLLARNAAVTLLSNIIS